MKMFSRMTFVTSLMFSMSLVQAARVEVRLPMSYNKRMAIIAAGAAAGAVGLHCLPKVVGKLFPRSIVRGLPALAAASSGVDAPGAAAVASAGSDSASRVGVPPITLPRSPTSGLPEADVSVVSAASAPSVSAATDAPAGAGAGQSEAAVPMLPQLMIGERVSKLEADVKAMQDLRLVQEEAQKIAATEAAHPAQVFGQIFLMQNLDSMGFLQQLVTMSSWPTLMSYATSMNYADIENFFSHNVDVPWGKLWKSIEHYRAVNADIAQGAVSQQWINSNMKDCLKVCSFVGKRAGFGALVGAAIAYWNVSCYSPSSIYAYSNYYMAHIHSVQTVFGAISLHALDVRSLADHEEAFLLGAVKDRFKLSPQPLIAAYKELVETAEDLQKLETNFKGLLKSTEAAAQFLTCQAHLKIIKKDVPLINIMLKVLESDEAFAAQREQYNANKKNKPLVIVSQPSAVVVPA